LQIFNQIAPAPVVFDDDDDDDDEGDDLLSPEEDRANLSTIVRFAREVNSRRISTDYHFTAPASTSAAASSSDAPALTGASSAGNETRLDITNFPKGPLFESTGGGGSAEGFEEKCH
jgi:hypothetical protein